MGGDAPSARDLHAADVSIRAPAWGATWMSWVAYAKSKCFNPRPRMGGDPWLVVGHDRLEDVSIRAPAWGATRRTTDPLTG